MNIATLVDLNSANRRLLRFINETDLSVDLKLRLQDILDDYLKTAEHAGVEIGEELAWVDGLIPKHKKDSL